MMLRCSLNNNSLGLCVIIPVLESSSYNISLWDEFKRPTITFGWPTIVTQQQWLNTCERHKEAEEVKRTHDLNRCGLLLDQQECVAGLFDGRLYVLHCETPVILKIYRCPWLGILFLFLQFLLQHPLSSTLPNK